MKIRFPDPSPLCFLAKAKTGAQDDKIVDIIILCDLCEPCGKSKCTPTVLLSRQNKANVNLGKIDVSSLKII